MCVRGESVCAHTSRVCVDVSVFVCQEFVCVCVHVWSICTCEFGYTNL